jgi:hypothetical protein
MIHVEYTFNILGGQRGKWGGKISKRKDYYFPTDQEGDSLLLQGQINRHLPLIFASPYQDMW